MWQPIGDFFRNVVFTPENMQNLKDLALDNAEFIAEASKPVVDKAAEIAKKALKG